MLSLNQTENLRDSYRYPTNDSHQQAQMRFGETWTPVELLDESAGGFGVSIDQLPEVAIGDVVRLRYGAKCFDVEVMHITQCPPVSDFHNEKRGESLCLLGLKRVSEIFQEMDTGVTWFEQIRATWQRPLRLLDGKDLAVGLVLAFLAGILPIAVLLPMGTRLLSGQDSNSSTGGNSTIPEEVGSYHNPFKVQLGGEVGGSSATAPDSVLFTKPSLNDRQKDIWQLLLDRAKLQTDTGPLRDSVLAVIANLAEQINLTDLRQAEIVQLLRYTDKSLAKLDAGTSVNNPDAAAQKRLSILQDAYANLMQMLTDKQQVEWDELVEKWDDTSNAK